MIAGGAGARLGRAPMAEAVDFDAAVEIGRAHEMVGQEHWECPWRNIAQLLAARARESPNAPYLTFVDDDTGERRDWTYSKACDHVGRAVTLLQKLGVGAGDRVAFLIGSLDYTILLYLATWSLGACVVPINAGETTDRKQFVIDNSRATWLFARTDYLADAETVLEDREVGLVAVDPSGATTCISGDRKVVSYHTELFSCEPEQLDAIDLDCETAEALIVYTSGTTGNPKGVVLTQYNMLVDADAMSVWHGWSAEMRAMCVLPITHVNGIIVTHVTPLYLGASTVLTSRFNSHTFWQHVADERVSMVSVVPTLLEFLLQADTDLSSLDVTCLKSIICGAGPLLVETAMAFEDRFGIPITHGYGLSETTCYNCHMPPGLPADEHKAWLSEHGFPSIGLALPHQEMAILDDDDTAVPDGERGEICVRGDTVSAGYYARPDANAQAFRNGWFHSGDEGFSLPDANGRQFLFITGRIKELIIRGGINYSPLEIDAAINSHDQVRYGLAVPFANRFYGDEIAAYVVLVDGSALEEEVIIEWCKDRLGHAKAPKVVIFGTDVPYTTTGKPKRLELARLLSDQLAPYREVQFRKAKA